MAQVKRGIESLEGAALWLEGLINYERRPSFKYRHLGLAAIEALMKRVGDPQTALSIIHIAGSKGKGSTGLFCEAILVAAGEHVGTFTSPHLERWTERFRIGGLEIEGSELAAVVEHLRPHVEALRKAPPEQAPTFFDATTAAALLLFKQQKVTQAILEVGLGGRLDSTNVVSPRVTCVTQIELEHTEKLGSTLAEIASEKAGIIKMGVPCVVGCLAKEAAVVLSQRAQQMSAPLSILGRDFEVEQLDLCRFQNPLSGQQVRQAGIYRAKDGFELTFGLSVLGAHQLDNAAMALTAVRKLEVIPDSKLVSAVQEGLIQARLPGRIELFSEAPWILVDAAHTDRSIQQLRLAIDEIAPKKLKFVISVSQDKKLINALALLLQGASHVWSTRADPIRSTDPEELALLCRELEPGARVEVLEKPEEAILGAVSELSPGDLVCCVGSIYLAGIARRCLTQKGPPPSS